MKTPARVNIDIFETKLNPHLHGSCLIDDEVKRAARSPKDRALIRESIERWAAVVMRKIMRVD